MDSIEFLLRHGTLVQHATEVKTGDIVGRQNVVGNNERSGVRLYYVSGVMLEPTPPCLLMDVPRVNFLPPHVGLSVVDGQVIRYYIHTPMCGESYQYSWAKHENAPDDPEFLEIRKSENFKMYLIHDADLIALGQLIPKVVVPSWAFMCQTPNKANIHNFVQLAQADLLAAQLLHDRVKNLALSLSR
jgi:hypothetical protein